MSKISKDEFVKNQILEGAKEVFRKYGYKNAKMEQIAKESGKGRSTLYYYYESKEAVFKAFVTDFNQPLFNSLKTKLTPTNTLEKNCLTYIQAHFENTANGIETYGAILNDLKQDIGFVAAILLQIRQQDLDVIKSFLVWAIEKEEIKPIEESNLNFLATVILNTKESVKKEYFIYETIQGDPIKRLKWITKLLINSLK
ncbi:transcriptional regulator, TetR family [Mesonia phycicola]|uniref:Transcriptional regulator, TetR family n=1 Tax=Mesonia phycicola TaxID=579105 RepID=A0A1M6FBA6_9FLAO|nr:TetR/AcrR family transcriptional regulator [Mesonia phycicola]SHI94931.1 transcriptional regulator, TetR family [Mesonia phycicola]